MTLRYISANDLTSAGDPYIPAKIGYRLEPAGAQSEGSAAERYIDLYVSPIGNCYYSGVVLKSKNLISFLMSAGDRSEVCSCYAIPPRVHHQRIQHRMSIIEGPSADTGTYMVCDVRPRQNDWLTSLAEVESLIDSIENGIPLQRSSTIMELAQRASQQPGDVADIDEWAWRLAQDIVNADD